MHTMCVPCLKDQKKVSDFLELELDNYDPPHMGVGNSVKALCKNSKCS